MKTITKTFKIKMGTVMAFKKIINNKNLLQNKKKWKKKIKIKKEKHFNFKKT